MRALFGAIFLVLATQGAGAASLAEKAALQAVMQRHIERILVDGAVLHIDPEDGTVERLYPSQTHPQVLKADGYYVLCVDLKGADGAARPADFYIAPQGAGYVVFKTAIDDRALLRKLMADGRVARMN